MLYFLQLQDLHFPLARGQMSKQQPDILQPNRLL
jgi:hypothetical protein